VTAIDVAKAEDRQSWVQALGAHKLTLQSFSDLNMPKNSYFMKKAVKNRRNLRDPPPNSVGFLRLGALTSDLSVVTLSLTYY